MLPSPVLEFSVTKTQNLKFTNYKLYRVGHGNRAKNGRAFLNAYREWKGLDKFHSIRQIMPLRARFTMLV